MIPDRSMKVITYARVSTQEQGDSQLGLEAQRRVMSAWVEARKGDVKLWRTFAEVGSAADLERPQLAHALAMLDQGSYDTLVVAKLDRLSRSVADFAAVCDRAKRMGWRIVVLDIGIDMSTPTGELVANILMSVAQWERRMISVRTTEALAAKKARGERVGPTPADVDPEVVDIIRESEPWFFSWETTSHALNERGLKTPKGSDWSRASLYRWVMRNKGLVGHPGAVIDQEDE